MSEPLVVIGNGMAAARFVQEMTAISLGRFAIAVIGDEPRLAYNRVLLSSVLAGEVASEDIDLHSASWWRDRGVTLCYGSAVTSVDVGKREVVLENGSVVRFSKLVFATGSQPIRLNVPGANLPQVHTFRDSRDVDLLVRLAGSRGRVVVVGGGLLGLEAAYGLARAGAQVTLVHLMDRLMERQLDQPTAALLKRLVEQKAIEVLLEASTAAILGSERVEAIELADGRLLKADAVVFAAGIRPNTMLAKTAGIATNRGILVDDHLSTSAPGVYALGECAEHNGVCYGLVEPAYEQARVLARIFAGSEARYRGSVTATNLKVSGVNVFSAGNFSGHDASEEILWSDIRNGSYKKLVVENERLIGAVLVGDTRDALWYLELIRSGASIKPLRNDLMFGRMSAGRQAA